MTGLHHEEIEHHPERTSLLQQYDDQYVWIVLEFPFAIQKIVTFEESNTGVTVNMLFNSEKSIYEARRSELNGKCSRQANLLMTVNGEKRQYTAIKICQGYLSL